MITYNNKKQKIEILRIALYKKYSRKQLSVILNLSEVQISRLLNNKSEMKLEQYIQLQNLLDR